MKQSLLLALTLSAIALPLAAQQTPTTPVATNLVKNGDFEEDSPAVPPTGWVMFGPNESKKRENYARDTTQAHGGKASMRVTRSANLGGYLISAIPDNCIPVKKGMTYTITLWAKSDAPRSGQAIVFLVTSVTPLAAKPLRGAKLDVDKDWKQFSLSLTEGRDFSADTTKYLALGLSASDLGPSPDERTVWFDDVTATETPAN